jgi:spore germination cell wall hydrolase CwlJ-like protein
MLDNIYHEARGESLEGQIAVARVTLNRAVDSSVCRAVYAPYQFSWTAKKHKPITNYPYETYLAAHMALFLVFPATHYHATYVKPKWASKLVKLKQIDNHVFYTSTKNQRT